MTRIKINVKRRLTEGKQLLNEVSLEKAKESLDSKKLLKAIRQYAINYAHSEPWEWKDVHRDDDDAALNPDHPESSLRPQALNNMVSTMHDSLKGWIWDMIPEDIETDRTRRDKSNQALALLVAATFGCERSPKHDEKGWCTTTPKMMHKLWKTWRCILITSISWRSQTLIKYWKH